MGRTLQGERANLSIVLSGEHDAWLTRSTEGDAEVSWGFAPGTARTVGLTVPRHSDLSLEPDRYLASVVLLSPGEDASACPHLFITAAIGLYPQGPRRVAFARPTNPGSENVAEMPGIMIAHGALSLAALAAFHRARLDDVAGPLPRHFLPEWHSPDLDAYTFASQVHDRMAQEARLEPSEL